MHFSAFLILAMCTHVLATVLRRDFPGEEEPVFQTSNRHGHHSKRPTHHGRTGWKWELDPDENENGVDVDGKASIPNFFKNQFKCKAYSESMESCKEAKGLTEYVTGEKVGCNDFSVDYCEANVAKQVWKASPAELHMSPRSVTEKYFSGPNDTLILFFGDSIMKQQWRSLSCLLELGGAKAAEREFPVEFRHCQFWTLMGKSLSICRNRWSENFTTVLQDEAFRNTSTRWGGPASEWLQTLGQVVVYNGVGMYYQDTRQYYFDLRAFLLEWKNQRGSLWEGPKKPKLLMREPIPQHVEDNCMKFEMDTQRKVYFENAVGLKHPTVQVYDSTRMVAVGRPDSYWKPKDCLHYCFPVSYTWNAKTALVLESILTEM